MCPQFDQLIMSQISLQYFAKACLCAYSSWRFFDWPSTIKINLYFMETSKLFLYFLGYGDAFIGRLPAWFCWWRCAAYDWVQFFSLSWSQSRNCQRWNCAEAGGGKLLSRYFCTPSLYQIEGTPEREYYIHLSKIIHNWCQQQGAK